MERGMSPTPELSVTENVVLSSVVAVAFICSLLPLYAWIGRKDLTKVIRVFGIAAMWAGVLNSAMWIGFSTLMMKSENCLELVLGYPLSLLANFIFLTLVHGQKKQYILVILVAIISIPSITWTFFAVRLSYSPLGPWEMGFGIVGLFFLVVSHVLIIRDLNVMKGRFEYLFSFFSIAPNGVINAIAFYVLVTLDPKLNFLNCSVFIGAIFAFAEVIMILSNLFYHFKANGQPGGDGGLLRNQNANGDNNRSGGPLHSQNADHDNNRSGGPLPSQDANGDKVEVVIDKCERTTCWGAMTLTEITEPERTTCCEAIDTPSTSASETTVCCNAPASDMTEHRDPPLLKGKTGGSVLHPLLRAFAGPYSKLVKMTMPRPKKNKVPVKRYKDKHDLDSLNKSNTRDLDLAPVVAFNGALCAPRHRSKSFARGVNVY